MANLDEQTALDSEEHDNLLEDFQERRKFESEETKEDLSFAPLSHGEALRRQSSFAQPRPNGTPRTPNRVRFDVNEAQDDPRDEEDFGWLEDEGSLDSSATQNGDFNVRLPLLTSNGRLASVTLDVGDIPGVDQVLEHERPRSGVASAFMNMANSIIGAGIIGQPYAFRQAGLVAGIILLLGLSLVVDWTIRLIVINSKLSGTSSFQGTVQHCFGKSGLVAISAAQWAFAFGGMLAFCIIVGDTIPQVFRAFFPHLDSMPLLWLLTNRRAVIALFILGISFPLCLYRDIAKLARASFLALISMLIILMTVISQGFRIPDESRGPIEGGLLLHPGILQAVGVISFAFVCHHNSLLIYGSLRTPTIDRFAKVTHLSTITSAVACLAMALAGYLTFGNKTQGNVLNNFPSTNFMVNIARLCFGLNMLTTLPLECFVCREVILNCFFPNDPYHPTRNFILSTCLVVSATALALLTCNLGGVFELIGATSACMLAYILPPLCYLKLSTRSWKSYVAGACVVFGGIVMGTSLFWALFKNTKDEGNTTTCQI